ncbi:MAG TPA: tripartite tricarboxylate transporter permease [Burkholderiales bacterium]|nr:tripartite tricarboxylate transporter permease [Burkholderiales bacterium]
MTGLGLAWQALTTSWAVPAVFAGVAWGIIGGALPGISPSVAMALLLPFTHGMDPVVAIAMLASVYVGAEYGGSIPAILIRTPGTNAAAATVIDGFEMNRRGRGGEALGISLTSGLVGGLFGLLVLAAATGPLARMALAFTAPAYFALGILGLSAIAGLSGRSLVKGGMAACLGLMIATIGTDPVSGVPRFTFDSPDLLNGIRPIVVMVGLFAVTELIAQVVEPDWEKPAGRARLKLPDWAMWKRLRRAQAIGSVIGAFEGATPGAAGSVASFLAYNEARRWSKHPEEFGKGSPEGVAAPECANNVVTGTALVPLLGLGIPGSNSAAVLMGGLLLHGMTPGPMLFVKNADVVYGLYGGLFVANLAMLILGLIILTPCLWLVTRPKHYLMAFILALVVTGVYSIEQSLFDVALALGVGVLGYGLRYFGVPQLPLVLGAVLGFMIESNYRRSLVLSGGDHRIFVQDPVSLGLLACAAALVIYSLVKRHD